ncbi:hypothetical protein [Streptomyces sp. NPDC057686]|uniref:hypothetical protein n=1 Tax=Streptomyces sp. NPDC057686 TaxID=3346212 RepID=UPI0036936B6D
MAAVNQLAALPDEHWPGGKTVFANLDGDTAMAFLERYPTPAAASKLTAGQLEAWCKCHGYSSKESGSVLFERLHAAPKAASRPCEAVVEQLVHVQVQLVQRTRTTIRTLDQAIRKTSEPHPYTPLFATMPRIGQVIGEIGPILERARTRQHLIAEAGVIPVTHASGKSRTVAFRLAANRKARVAPPPFSDNSRHGSDWAAKIYNDARALTKRHPHAIRILARAWLRMMWACCRDGAPGTHQANNKINTTAKPPSTT